MIAAIVVFGAILEYRFLPYRFRIQLCGLDSPFNEMAFDQKAWIEETEWEDDPSESKQPLRGMMLDDLFDNYLKTGMTKEEVGRLLGPHGDGWTESTDREWHYRLGAWSGFRMDGDYITLEFDKRGRLVKFWAWQS